MAEIDSHLKFGDSDFRGPPSLYLDLKRWFVQFSALLTKNALILWRRKLSLLSFIILPSFVVLVFLMEGNDRSSSEAINNLPAVPLVGLGECNVYFNDRCVRTVYSPKDDLTDAVMTSFSEANLLEMNKDVIGFNTTQSAREFVADNLGVVQYTIFFSNNSLWDTDYYSPNGGEMATNLSYVIFYNDTIDDNDPRSNAFNLNYPLLTLQKEIETAFFNTFQQLPYEGYEVNYGQFWQQEAIYINGTSNNNTTPCDWKQRPDLTSIGTIMPWVIVFSFLFMATISFYLIADERRNKLFGFLRRLGLMDSAYWLSWFLTFQILLLIACGISMIVAAIVRTKSSALRAIDLRLLFLIVYLTGTSFIAFSCFLAALSSSASMTTSLYSAEFLIALITVAACSSPINSYQSVGYTDGGINDSVCYLISSSYNRVYSPSLLGYEFVQFLVFFLPWFHAAQAITDVISIVQYKDQSIGMSDITKEISLSYTNTSTNTFDSPWIVHSLIMLLSTTILYMFLSWLVAQMLTSDGTEGRSIQSILLPTPLRRLLFRQRDEVQEGDLRGEERQRSEVEGSVRAYKVSKTFSGVQALREVSFSMNKGEVFVLLGHNGAGKSTLINIITGVVTPTHGKVYLQGLDVERDSAAVQQVIGVCPQDDVLWDDLTAREHMLLVAAFKGLRWGEVLFKAVDQVLQQVQLLDRAQHFARTYSGGMKRRLSVALSTVGDVQVIFFDEPTTGLDPLSRRRVWETINSLKRDRVVVLTTHNMEEADFLGDTIMIMHGGRVRAIGDPLFLKQTYGNGYQVGMLVQVQHIDEVKTLITQILPGSHCVADSLTGVLAVGVIREDLGGLSRLFQWLENSRRAKAAVREWGISNTTLEQVFLMLCVQNTEVNYVDPSRQVNQTQHTLCPMCRVRTRSPVITRVWVPNTNTGTGTGTGTTTEQNTITEDDIVRTASTTVTATHSNITTGIEMMPTSSPLIALADSVCAECARGNQHYYISEELANETATNPALLTTFIENAQVNAEMAKTEAMLSTYADEADLDGDSAQWNTALPGAEESKGESETLLPVTSSPQRPPQGSSIAATPTLAGVLGPNQASIQGTASSQVEALFVKNIMLQSKQRCSNACSVCFVGVMFLMLYIFSLLLGGLSNLTQCDQGYISSDGCDSYTLIHQIFSGTDDQLAFGEADTDLNLGPDGYAIRNYLVPVEQYNSYNVRLYGVNVVDSTTPSYGLSSANYRSNVLWSSLLDTEQLWGVQDLNFNMRGQPTANGANETEFASNEVQFISQQETYLDLIASPDGDSCPYYDSKTLTGSYGYSSWQVMQNFSDVYSDTSFACPSCDAIANGQRPSRVYFNGTLWMQRNKGATEYWCSSISCYAYPYGFINYLSSDLLPSVNYLPSASCPSGVGYFSKSSSWEQDQTLLAMTYTNLLSNSLLDPWLHTYSVQGGYSHYGVLFFDAQFISESQAFWMVLIGLMLMNGFWPMAVWRAGHERAFGLVDMMNTVGLRPWTYLLGMFAFDMVISLVSGVALLAFAVGLQLLNFKDAPIDLLVAIVILSAYAFNASTLLISMLAGSKASILSLLAACLTIGFAAISALLNNLVFPNDGDWPLALSLLPFLAQGRALYIVLVYHTSSPEVSGSLLLLFGVGTVILLVAFAIDERESILPHLAKLTSRLRGSSTTAAGIPPTAVVEGEDGGDHEKERAGSEHSPVLMRSDKVIPAMQLDEHGVLLHSATTTAVGGAISSELQRELDEDLHREKRKAEIYVRNKLKAAHAALSQNSPTIVVTDVDLEQEGAVLSELEQERLAIVLDKMKFRFPTGSALFDIHSICGPTAATTTTTTTVETDPSVTWAVDGMSLALSLGECFGLLGPNGAGKSTTISVLIGRLHATLGAQYIAGENVINGLSKIHRYIGVCPQFDVVWADLTVSEHLSFQARQRGVPFNLINAKVQQAAVAVGLDGDGFYTKAGQLSGGMRRRLSIAMSLVGDPPIIFMDEPTTGLDPDNRQHIWHIIQKIKSPNRLILLTTHSMEEAEALCTRIGIMAKGKLRCIGSAQHLKTKYGKGYTLTVNSLPVSNEAEFNEKQAILDNFIMYNVGGGQATLLSAINRTKKYLLNKTAAVSIAEIFKLMEANKTRLFIREWGLSMTTLEEVFISAVDDTAVEV